MTQKKSARKAIGKKTRFEVFKRDGFTCQYCGAHPPAVILHVDHIHPAALGGDNGMDNLITACEPCNLGKSAKALGEIPQSLKDKAAEIAEREAQIKGYYTAIEDKRHRLEDDAEAVCAVYERFNDGYTLTDSAMTSVKMFVEKLGKYEVMDAMERAYSRPARSSSGQFKYFCGICWNKIREIG